MKLDDFNLTSEKYNNNVYTTLDYLTKISHDNGIPNFILGGSFILKELGLIKRDVYDLDIFFYNKTQYNKFTLLLSDDCNIEEETGTSFRGKECDNITSIMGYNHNGINIDVLHLKTPENAKDKEISSIIINGETYYHQPISVILKAKQDLINNYKHKKDLDYIISNYNPNYNTLLNSTIVSTPSDDDNDDDDDDLPF